MKTSYLLLTSLAILASSAFGRTWTSVDGRTIEADFIRLTSDSVIVDRGGKTVTIPLDKLAKVDHDWLASQDSKPDTDKTTKASAERITQILESALESQPSKEERQEVVDFLTSLLPTKGAEGEDIEWDMTFPPSGDTKRSSVLLAADMHPKGDTDTRLMWFHFVFQSEPDKMGGRDKVGGYPAVRAEDRHCFISVKRMDVRGVADSENYRNDKKIDAVLESIDLKAISKL